jgi:hypothetical protein
MKIDYSKATHTIHNCNARATNNRTAYSLSKSKLLLSREHHPSKKKLGKKSPAVKAGIPRSSRGKGGGEGRGGGLGGDGLLASTASPFSCGNGTAAAKQRIGCARGASTRRLRLRRLVGAAVWQCHYCSSGGNSLRFLLGERERRGRAGRGREDGR